jgi:hypothetical protein
MIENEMTSLERYFAQQREKVEARNRRARRKLGQILGIAAIFPVPIVFAYLVWLVPTPSPQQEGIPVPFCILPLLAIVLTVILIVAAAILLVRNSNADIGG